MVTKVQLVLDCADPEQVGRFWADALGYAPQAPPDGYASWPEFLAASEVPEESWNSAFAIVDPEGVGARYYFQRVPEPKAVKNRIHLDLNVGGGSGTPVDRRRPTVNAEVDRLVTLGARVTRRCDENDEYWVVMADVEGNEFCVQ